MTYSFKTDGNKCTRDIKIQELVREIIQEMIYSKLGKHVRKCLVLLLTIITRISERGDKSKDNDEDPLYLRTK